MEHLLQLGSLRTSRDAAHRGSLAGGKVLVWAPHARVDVASEVSSLPRAEDRQSWDSPSPLCFWGGVWECMSASLYFSVFNYFFSAYEPKVKAL